MNKAALFKELMELPPEERLQLAEELWDSLAAEDMPLTDEQKREIDRRIAEHERDPSSALPWQEVRKWLWSNYK